ncbi:DUF5107 domain-containing protein [Halobacillus litoralis]|uniref:aldose epimerase family protein n=1 Tax=Halobacillus litoralis TaxID=45668 RepID=UPI001CD23F89|nr:DUF5107 domain-containing protein [Halobacillus litoralis]MCA0971524.1 DUF5107 domain-containing protein [Halobacillus litoralis]
MIDMAAANKTNVQGIEAVCLENDRIRCILLPSYGGKMVSLYDKQAQYEWLFQSERGLSIPPYGADFSEHDSSGFDEMFPGIDQGPHPTFSGTIPDHGEVWAMPWSFEERSGECILQVESAVFPYTLEKRMKLNESSVEISYKAINSSSKPFPFIWTPHALLRMHDETYIDVPDHLDQVINVEHGTKHLGEWGTCHSYPGTKSVSTGQSIDLSKLEPFEDQTVEKFYFKDRLQEGWCSMVQPHVGRRLTYRFPVDQVPYLGVWKTRGGYRGEYNVALEPCTGIYDDVYVAEKIKKCSSIPANGAYEWTFEMELGGA